MARARSGALLVALALCAQLALAQTVLPTAAAIPTAAPVVADGVDSAALTLTMSDANSATYAADAPPVSLGPTEAPAVAEAPQAGVSAWVAPSDTQASSGMWNVQRLLEAAVGMALLVLVLFFILTSTRQAFESWEVEKSGEGTLKGQGGGPGTYGALDESFREASGLYPVKLGGYAPNSPALPVGLRGKSSSGNLEGSWDEERGAGPSADPWESHQQPSRVRQQEAPPANYSRHASASRVQGSDRQSSRVPTGERTAQQLPSRGPASSSSSDRDRDRDRGGSGSSSSRSGSGQPSARPSGGSSQAQARPAADSQRRGSAGQAMQRGPYQPAPRNL